MKKSWIEIIHEHHVTFQEQVKRQDTTYPMLKRAATILAKPTAPILGRDMKDLRQGLRNPEKANVILLADPGAGKTAFVQGFAYNEQSVHYIVVSIDIERLAKDTNGDKDIELQNGLLDLVEEAKRYSEANNVFMVLFIDEFHRIAMLSPSAVESLKPILEKSAVNGFRIIAATTFEEYDKWISVNRALDQRLLRFTLQELGRDAVIGILKSRAKQYGILDDADETVFGDIYDYSKQILISNSQPRASIDILMNMVGVAVKDEYMENGKPMRVYATPKELGLPGEHLLARPLLNRVIQRTYGIDIDNQISVTDVKRVLTTTIYNQDVAVTQVMKLLELMLSGFNDPTRPKISFLSTGTTGTGKTELAKQISTTLGIPLKRFDMSRYPRPEDAVYFANELAAAAWSAPNAYILIDEAEKSTREAMNILLQVLDDARLTASNNANRVISFTGCIINLTTNLGSEIFDHMYRYGDHKGQQSEKDIDIEAIYKALADDPRFETAVLGRLDAIIPFVSLPKSALERIAKRELDRNIESVTTDKRSIYVSPDVIPYIVEDRTSTESERGGARDIKRNIKNIVLGVLASYLAYAKEEVPIALYVEGEPRFKYKDVGDPLNANLTYYVCHSKDTVRQYLDILGEKLHTILYDDGLFIPKEWTLKDFATQVVPLIRLGGRRFYTTIDGETIYVNKK